MKVRGEGSGRLKNMEGGGGYLKWEKGGGLNPSTSYVGQVIKKLL